MDSRSVYGDDQLKNEAHVAVCTSEDLDSLWLQDSSTPPFHAPASSAMVSFEDVRGVEDNTDAPPPQKPIFPKINSNAKNTKDSAEESILDSFSQKKRRLSSDQVRFLDKSFEADNKLEPERKLQLAKELGLQPRQVAIWFQNRRARFKTKLMEKDYDALKSNYEKLKEDYDSLHSENEKLKTEVNLLAEKLLTKADDGDRPIKKEGPFDDDVKQQSKASCSAKSDVMDSDADGNHSSAMLESEPGDSSQLVEPVGAISDYDEEDESFAKLEEPCYYYGDLQPNSDCNLGFPVQNHHGAWFWQV